MRNQSVSITPTFAPETEFEIVAQSRSWQFDRAEVQEVSVAAQIRPIGQKLFEKRGVPFSALND